MQVRYYLNELRKDKNTYVVLYMPEEVIKKCNFEHKDMFNIAITDNNISIKYGIGGGHRLAKLNKNLVFHYNAKTFTNKTIDLLKACKTKHLPASIVGDKFIIDLTKLASKPKGFNLFQVVKSQVNKGFGIKQAQ